MGIKRYESKFVDDLLVMALRGCISNEAKDMVRQAFDVFHEDAENQAMDETCQGFDPDDESAGEYLHNASVKILDQRIGLVLWRACDV